MSEEKQSALNSLEIACEDLKQACKKKSEDEIMEIVLEIVNKC